MSRIDAEQIEIRPQGPPQEADPVNLEHIVFQKIDTGSECLQS